MRFFHPLYKLKAPKILTDDGISTNLITAFQTDHRRNIYNIFLKGQNGLPIRQHDVDTGATKMWSLTTQRLAEYEARIKSLERETQDLIQQLSEPLETEKPETSFLDKAFSTWEKIKKLRRNNDG